MKNFDFRNNFLPLFFLMLLMFAFGCEDTPPTQKPNDLPEENTESGSADNPAENDIFILTASATSQGEKSSPVDFLDNNSRTLWISKPGTGPEEYIHLEFLTTVENYVDKIRINCPDGGRMLRVLNMFIDVNGSFKGMYRPGTDISIKSNLKSLTIRFTKIEQLVRSEKNMKDRTVYLEKSIPGKSIGVADILFYGGAEELLRPRFPQNYIGKISASSTLQPKENYSPVHLFDGKSNLAWAPSARTDGKGETLRFSLVGEAPVKKLYVLNGFGKSTAHFEETGKVKTFSLKTENDAAQTFTLRNDMSGQLVTLEPSMSGKNYEMVIKEVYPGSKYKDAAISELAFIRPDNQVWRVEDGELSPGSKRLSGVPSDLIDRYVACIDETTEQVTKQSLILRSDGTFDLRSIEETNYDDERNWHARGTWEEQSTGKINLTGGIKIGKDKEYSFFNDEVKISSTAITGRDYFDKILLE